MAERRLAVFGMPAFDFAGDAAPSEETRQRLYEAMTLLAAACIEQGLTQTAADILAFLLRQPDLSVTARAAAEDIFADLESRICPRVIYDAKEFATDMDLSAMIEYALDTLEGEPNLTLAQRPLGVA